jgi:hypothetical protein
MDFDEERDYADQGSLTDMDMEEDVEILSLLLKYMPSCVDADEIEQLARDIPVQPRGQRALKAASDILLHSV